MGRALVRPPPWAGVGWSMLVSCTQASHPEMQCKFWLRKDDTEPAVTKQQCESSGFVFPKVL